MMNDSKSPPDFVAPYLNKVPRSGIRDFFEIVSTRKDVISLGIGEPDFVTPWHIRESSVYALNHGSTSYTANLGLLELREAVAEYVERSYQASYDPRREIMITVGVSEALDLAIRALVSPGDEVLYHEPCYVSYAPVVTFAHGVPVAVETSAEDGFRLTVQALEQKVTPRTKVLMLNFPTNPTGAVLNQKDVEDIAAFAIRHNLVVITDEIYSELTYEAERVSIAAVPGMKERTIFLNGFSKTWAMTGFRIGFSCAPPALTDAMMKLHQYTMLCAPILAQKAAIEALENGDAAVESMRATYRQRRNLMMAGFGAAGLPCQAPQGAFYAFPYIRHTGLTSRQFALRFLEEQNVACVPGTAFGACGEGYIRCAYATATEKIAEAMQRMQRFVLDITKTT
jgi:aminotransferase